MIGRPEKDAYLAAAMLHEITRISEAFLFLKEDEVVYLEVRGDRNQYIDFGKMQRQEEYPKSILGVYTMDRLLRFLQDLTLYRYRIAQGERIEGGKTGWMNYGTK